MKTSVFPLLIGLALGMLSSTGFSESSLDDSSVRRNTAARIAREHQVMLDWRQTTLLELMDTEARLNAVKRIRSTYGVAFDWRKISLSDLMDVEARMGAAKRIGQATKKTIDWKQYTLVQLMEMEAGLSGVDLEAIKKQAAASTARRHATAGTPAGLAMQKVEYISDSIAERDGKYIRLLSGSSWVLASTTLALVMDDIIIVFWDFELKDRKKVRVAVAHIDGDEIIAKHVDGQYVARTGYLTTVVQQMGDGAILKLADGSILTIPQYDRYETGWWLPPYRPLLTGNKMYMYNLKKGKRVWVNAK